MFHELDLLLGNSDLISNSLLSFLLGKSNLSGKLFASRLDQGLLLIQELWLVDLLSLLNIDWISLDLVKDLLHELLNRLGLVVLETLVPEGKLLHVSLIGLALENLHVVVNMDTKDSVSVNLGIEGLLLAVLVLGETWELVD